MCIYHLLNVCDVWKNSVYSHHTSPILTSISTYPLGVDLALRTDWCVWLPWIIVDPCKYFRMCIYHLHNVCDVWKKISLLPSYLAHPYQHQHVPTRRLGVATRLVRTATMNICRPAKIFSKLPYVHISSSKRLWRVKKFSLFPSYLAHPYQHQHVPTRSRLDDANRLVRMATMHNCRPA